MSKKIYRKSTQTIDGNPKVVKDPIAARTEEADWENVQKRPLGYNEDRDSIEPIRKIEVDEIDVTARLGVTHNADIGGKLTAHEAVFGDDVAIHGDLYVEGTTTTTNEAQVSTSGDYIVTRENNPADMSNSDHAGLVVNNYADGKLGAITIKHDGTWRVSADVSSSSNTYEDIVLFNKKIYDGLTDTEVDPQPKLDILTNVIAGELPHCVIYDHKFYHNDGSEWKGPEEWDAVNHVLKAEVITDADTIAALDAITDYYDLVYYETVTTSSISIDSEQPILTREEEGDIENNGLLKYNKTTNRAEDIAVPTIDDTALFAQVDDTGVTYLWKKVAGVVWVDALPESPNILTNLYVYTDENGKVTYHVGDADTQTLLEMKMDAIEYVSTLPTGNSISNKVYAIKNASDSSETKFYFGCRNEDDPSTSELIALDSKAVIWVDAVPETNIQDKVYVVGKRVYVGSKASSKVQEVGTPWFYGTKAEWDSLSAAEKKEYEYVVLSDDFSAANIVVDKVEQNNLNAVSSNAVYDRYENQSISNQQIWARDLQLSRNTTHATEGGQIDLWKGTDYRTYRDSISIDAYYNQMRIWNAGANGTSRLSLSFDDGNMYWSKNGGANLNINGSIDTLKSDTAIGGAYKFKGPLNSTLSDLNNYTTMGIYYFQGNITSAGQYHFPTAVTGATWGNLEVIGTNTTRLTQRITFPFTHQRMEFVRYKHDSAWSGWYLTGGTVTLANVDTGMEIFKSYMSGNVCNVGIFHYSSTPVSANNRLFGNAGCLPAYRENDRNVAFSPFSNGTGGTPMLLVDHAGGVYATNGGNINVTSAASVSFITDKTF